MQNCGNKNCKIDNCKYGQNVNNVYNSQCGQNGNNNFKINNSQCLQNCGRCCNQSTAPEADDFFNSKNGFAWAADTEQNCGQCLCVNCTTGQTGANCATGQTMQNCGKGKRGNYGTGQTGPICACGQMWLIGPTGPTGAMGPMGATGPTGEIGPTGPTGPRGVTEEIVMGEIRASYDGTAAVLERKIGNQHIVDFIIPKGDKGDKGDKGEKGEKGDKGDPGAAGEKGDDGVADKIVVEGAEMLDNGDVPQVVDNYSGQTHNLTFKIPQGPAGLPGAKGDKGEQGEPGERGERGEPGTADKIAISSVEAIDENLPAQVEDDFQGITHNLSFKIPRGPSGLPGAKGEQGDPGTPGAKGDTGPTGETGPRGNSMIYGHFSTQFLENTATYVDINKTNFPYNTGDLEKGDVVVTHNGVLGSVLQVETDKNRIMLRPVADINGAKGDKGDPGTPGAKGDVGPTGPSLIRTSLVLGYNNDPLGFPVAGMPIQSGGRIPFVRVETNLGKLVTLNPDYSIQFAETGVYFVNFITNAYVKLAGDQFNPETDFVAVGFREENSNKVFAAANGWNKDEIASTMSGQGVFVVDDISKKYELVNLQKREIYVNAVDITKTITDSYFASVLATIVFMRLDTPAEAN